MIIGSQRVYVDGYDLSSGITSVGVDVSADTLDATTLGSDTSISAAGLLAPSISLSGLWDTPIDTEGWSAIGGAGAITTVAMVDGAAGDTAYFGQFSVEKYSTGGSAGDLRSLDLSSGGVYSPMVHGLVAAARAVRTTSGNSAAFNLGALPAGASAWIAAHVMTVTGTSPSLTVSLQSDDASGMTTPTTRLTLPAISAQGAAIGAVPGVGGGSSDGWWRASWAITGTSPSFDCIIVVGIALN